MAEQEIPWLGPGCLVIRPKGFGAFEQFKWGEGNTLWICHINANAGVNPRGAEFCEKSMKPPAYTAGKATTIGVPESGKSRTSSKSLLMGSDFGACGLIHKGT